MKDRLKVKEYNRNYYLKNKEAIIKNVKSIQKANNYSAEKTPYQRMIRNIKRKTRHYFQLKGHLCEFCGCKATEHHHNTNPIEFDRFNYICHECHRIVNNYSREGGTK